MTPEQAYSKAIEQDGFNKDPIQAQAVQLTQTLYEQLTEKHYSKSSNLFGQIKQLFQSSSSTAIKGLYFWGGVGRGKTWLIDTFFNTLPFSEKRRVHFHPFMLDVHQQLQELPKTPDPLKIIAKNMAQQFNLLCIDEFHVQDITDAMLLAGLLKALFDSGVTLVTTSNIEPEALYKNGLQRDRFLPAIELIKAHCIIFELKNKTDYRHLALEKAGCYHTPLNKQSDDLLLEHYIDLTQHAPLNSQSIIINNRSVHVAALNYASTDHPQTVIWFEFDELCNTARSNADYIELARQYSHIIIAHIYQMDEEKDDVAKRFMHLIDALYEQHCCLVVSSAVEPDELYQGRRLEHPFQRTVSRLKEMRSKLYRGKTCS